MERAKTGVWDGVFIRASCEGGGEDESDEHGDEVEDEVGADVDLSVCVGVEAGSGKRSSPCKRMSLMPR
jgi:hypothetical protein